MPVTTISYDAIKQVHSRRVSGTHGSSAMSVVVKEAHD